MEPTKMTFYDDVYSTDLDVEIIGYGVDERFGPYLVFDQTIFHPHGGGQKGDRGTVSIERSSSDRLEIEITDTRGEKTGQIKHILGATPDNKEILKAGNRGILHLNWDFRYNQMKLHSSSHLIHIFMEQAAGKELPPPRISDILEDYGLNIYEEILDFAPENLPSVLETMNEYLQSGHLISTHPDPNKPGFRYWQCDDFTIPCGGTHPANTKEIGRVTASISAKKGKTKVLFRLDTEA